MLRIPLTMRLSIVVSLICFSCDNLNASDVIFDSAVELASNVGELACKS